MNAVLRMNNFASFKVVINGFVVVDNSVMVIPNLLMLSLYHVKLGGCANAVKLRRILTMLNLIGTDVWF